MKNITFALVFLAVSCKDKTQHYNHYNNKDTVNIYRVKGTLDSAQSYGNGHIIYVGDTVISSKYKRIYSDTVYNTDVYPEKLIDSICSFRVIDERTYFHDGSVLDNYFYDTIHNFKK